MNCSRLESLTDDYLDGNLDAEVRIEIDRHLAGCPDCERGIEESRRLQRAVGSLPRGIAPERDLLPGIRDRLGVAEPGDRSPWRRWVAVAASVIVLTGAAWFGLRIVDRTPEASIASAVSSSALLAADINLAEFEAAELEYEEAAAHLLGIVEARGDELSPETRAVIEENLKIIDEAIDQVREALNEEPGDTRNGHILNALYRQKVEFLWRVSRLSS